MEYIVFWVIHEGVRPIDKKSKAILKMDPQKNNKGVVKFIGLINCYRYMWARWCHTLQQQTNFTSENVKFKWTSIERETSEEIKQIVDCDVQPSVNDKCPFFLDFAGNLRAREPNKVQTK